MMVAAWHAMPCRFLLQDALAFKWRPLLPVHTWPPGSYCVQNQSVGAFDDGCAVTRHDVHVLS